jgi:hypothetical protein
MHPAATRPGQRPIGVLERRNSRPGWHFGEMALLPQSRVVTV